MDSNTNIEKNKGNTDNERSEMRVYYINIDNLVNNDLNKVYSDQDITNLKNIIEANGLQDSLSVVKQGESQYRVVSGHRRLQALRELFKENKTVMFGNVELKNQAPCIFKDEFEDEDDEFLSLISSNVSRSKNPDDMRRVIRKTAEIYEKRKDLPGYEGKKRDVIAKMSGYGARSVDKYLKDNIELELKAYRIPTAISVVNAINKMIEQIKCIDMDEYGRSDRDLIKETMSELLTTLKKKRK